MEWSPQQAQALDAVGAWLKDRSRPFFYLAGYAGTGKTTLAKHLAGDLGNVRFGAFTGKAAAVMREKGCRDATTIHRLIYTAQEKGTVRLRELQEQLRQVKGEEPKDQALRIRLRRDIAAEVQRLRAPSFRLNESSSVRDAELVIIDECSMVNGRMADDLLSFGTPVLVLGDPAQLPPVAAGGYFTDREPDMMLTEVHRHAQESGILRLATEVREGKPFDYCDLGDARVLPKGELCPEEIPASFDQVLVGRNGTRRATNTRMRELMGNTETYPVPGDRLVCLRNDHDLGLLNGDIWTAVDCRSITDELLDLTVENGDEVLRVEVWKHHFDGRELAPFGRRDAQEFAYGWVLTTHKAQGSQWPRVIVFDESRYFRQNARRWLYTAITRASDELVVIR